ncbi:MAG: hypothetical protein WBQ03_05165 [Candidatus Sulfotelmatobacter sp.]
MRILLIGGNGFIGRFVAAQLVQRCHIVGVFHRGTKPTPPDAEGFLGDRNQLAASAQQLKLEDAIRRTISWEIENPPTPVPLAQFDYAAEDAAVAAHHRPVDNIIR